MTYRILAIDPTGKELPYAEAGSRRDAIEVAQHLAFYRVRDPQGKAIAEALPDEGGPALPTAPAWAVSALLWALILGVLA